MMILVVRRWIPIKATSVGQSRCKVRISATCADHHYYLDKQNMIQGVSLGWYL